MTTTIASPKKEQLWRKAEDFIKENVTEENHNWSAYNQINTHKTDIAFLMESFINETQPKTLRQVKDFHDAFKVETPNVTTLGKDRLELRARLIEEETNEVLEELKAENPNIEKIAKELADLQYVLNGTVLELGIAESWVKINDEVHRSNMSKLDKNGNPIYREDGKVLKSERYTKANLSFLNKWEI